MSNYHFAPSPSYGIGEHPFATWIDAFSEEELDKIVTYCDTLKLEESTVGSGETSPVEIRKSKVGWVEFNNETAFLYDRLAWVARSLNGQFFRYNVHGFSEHMQYTVYEGPDSGHYTWHLDSGVSNNSFPPRKLSLVLQLSSPEDYEGGELEILTSANPEVVTKKRGMIALFPSFRLHRVTPVTSGVRKTLVVWISGPSFV